MPKAKATAEKAIQLDDTSAEAHASLATFKLFNYEFDWAGSEREFQRAIALNPNYAFAHDQFGLALAFQGRLDESLAEGKRATELDPLSPQVSLDTPGTCLARQIPGSYRAGQKGEGYRSGFLRSSTGDWVDRYPSRENQRRHPGIAESQRDGFSRVGCCVPRVRLWSFRRPH